MPQPRMACLTLLAFLFLSFTTTAHPHTSHTVVQTQSGLLRGAIEGRLRTFRGIPYAAPPVGNLRWRPPAAVAHWNGVRDALAFGPLCPQRDASGQLRGDEDCLTLNIFTGKVQPSQDQPVVVFFHGGGNSRGSASQGSFDAPLLATNGVIVVTAEYRLGALGQFVHPLLSAEG